MSGEGRVIGFEPLFEMAEPRINGLRLVFALTICYPTVFGFGFHSFNYFVVISV